MRFLKQLSLVLTITAVFALPFGVMGCAEDASKAKSDTAADKDKAAETELGEPGEAGSHL